MQIDSFQHVPGNALHGDRDYLFADVGMIYVFYCFNCNQPESVFPCPLAPNHAFKRTLRT